MNKFKCHNIICHYSYSSSCHSIIIIELNNTILYNYIDTVSCYLHINVLINLKFTSVMVMARTLSSLTYQKWWNDGMKITKEYIQGVNFKTHLWQYLIIKKNFNNCLEQVDFYSKRGHFLFCFWIYGFICYGKIIINFFEALF